MCYKISQPYIPIHFTFSFTEKKTIFVRSHSLPKKSLKFLNSTINPKIAGLFVSLFHRAIASRNIT